MPFDARPVLEVAQFLADAAASDSDEFKLRAAVGRAYYAAFLKAPDFTGTTQIDNIHGEVIRRLWGRRGMMIAANKLKTLRELRVAADYEYPPALEAHRDWSNNWAEANRLATQILERLERR